MDDLGVFREPFTFRNSDAAILRFPFPFDEDRYVTRMNLEPHARGGPTPAFSAVFDVDEHYEAECAERAHILAADPRRCQVLPHMRAAEWDTLELLMESLAADYPRRLRPAPRRRPLALDQPPARVGTGLHFRRRGEPALPAVRIHHAPGAGRLHPAGSARRNAVPGRRHPDHRLRLVARLRPRHELPRAAWPGAGRARGRRVRRARSVR